MSPLKELRERVERASEISEDLVNALCLHFIDDADYPAIAGLAMRLLDPISAAGAALALLESKLPCAEYEITTLYGVAAVTIFNPVTAYGRREDGDVPLAILAALLSAIEHSEPAKREGG